MAPLVGVGMDATSAAGWQTPVADCGLEYGKTSVTLPRRARGRMAGIVRGFLLSQE